jgi:anti-sigma-K factor RskA
MTEEMESQAAEYVLGTLTADERTAFEALLTQSAEARAAVASWEQRLAPLAATIGDIAPSPIVWTAIQRRLQQIAGPARLRLADDVTTAIRVSRDRWRMGAIAFAALAACFAFFSVNRVMTDRREAAATYVAVVNRGGDLPALIIRVDLARQSIFVRPLAAQVPQGHSLELWWLGEGKPPKSMGLVDKDTRRVPLPAGAHVEKAGFAVTVEPPGGSPTHAPTGPIVYSGQLLKE